MADQSEQRQAIDQLYTLPLGEFTTARDEIARRLRREETAMRRHQGCTTNRSIITSVGPPSGGPQRSLSASTRSRSRRVGERGSRSGPPALAASRDKRLLQYTEPQIGSSLLRG